MEKLSLKIMTALAMCSSLLSVAQIKVGDNPTIISSSAVLEVESTTKGVLISRVALTSTLDATTIVAPATSLLVYNTATAGTGATAVKPGYYYWDGTKWLRFANSTTQLSSGLGAPTGTNPASPTAGDVYVNQTTGDIYTYNGTAWVNTTTTAAGSGAPTATNPANPAPGDIYVNTTTGDIYTYNGTTWENQSGVSADANNILVNGTDGLAYLSQSALQNTIGLSSGVGAPTATVPANPNAGDIYVNETTGAIYTYNGTTWVNQSTDPIIGNEVLDAAANGGLTRTGTGTVADPYKLKMTDGTTANQTMVWNGTAWVPGSTGLVATPLTSTTAPAGNTVGQMIYNTNASSGVPVGPTYWDGTTWQPVGGADPIIGNEVLDAATNGGLVRTGTGTVADPYKLKVTDGTTAGQVLTWDGTKWVSQASTSEWKLTGNAGTTAGTNFIGTTDAVDFITKTNNTERLRVTTTGNVGIGTATPTSPLHVAGPVASPILTTAANITLNTTHSVVKVDATAGNITVTLPDPTTVPGRTYIVVKADRSNNRLVFSHTIAGGDFTFTDVNVPGAYQLQSNGTNWNLIK